MTNTNDWRQAVEDEAQRLEAGAGLMRLIAMAEDQLDAIRFVSDLMAAAWHCDKARAAREHGHSAPNPPIPVSKLLTNFAENLREKLVAVAGLLPHEHRNRLLAIAPAVQASLEAQEPERSRCARARDARCARR
jgi:hypothetical protein